VPPDLIVYFDNLSRRSIGTVGHGAIHVAGNDTGPDDANHDPEGIFIAARMADLRRGVRRNIRITGASCLDITPTILHEYGLPALHDSGGTIIKLSDQGGSTRTASPRPSPPPICDVPAGKISESTSYSAEEEEIIKKRLTELGYI
jgi:hypothetical protein